MHTLCTHSPFLTASAAWLRRPVRQVRRGGGEQGGAGESTCGLQEFTFGHFHLCTTKEADFGRPPQNSCRWSAFGACWPSGTESRQIHEIREGEGARARARAGEAANLHVPQR